jgi:hypothetical protein
MKKILIILFFPLIAIAQEVDDALFKLENDPSPFFPFSVTGSYVDVSKTNFRSPDFKDKELIFRQWEAAFSYTHPLTPAYGLIFGAGWVGTEVNMKENPDFNETIFNYVNLLIGGFTKAFPDWLWRVTFAAYLDTEESSLVDYALYQGVLWGKYDLCKCVELDFGLIVESGLKKTKVWPIIGLIYLASPKWQISALYPVDISVNYVINTCWTAATSVRLLRSRHRVKENEINSQGIFEYRTTGIEFDLIYSPWLRFSVTGFAGSTGKGDLKISNRNDHYATHFKFNGSFYAGVTALLSF